MSSRRKYLIIAILMGILLAMVWGIVPTREPTCDGKSLTHWMAALGSADQDEEAHAFAAIERIGTNGLPFILRRLGTRDSALWYRGHPFTTDHPLTTNSSWFDTQEHPTLSFFCSTLLVALLLAPLVVVRLYCYAIDDMGAEPNPFPEPWWALLWGSAMGFFVGVCGAVPIVWFSRLLMGAMRRSRMSPDKAMKAFMLLFMVLALSSCVGAAATKLEDFSPHLLAKTQNNQGAMVRLR